MSETPMSPERLAEIAARLDATAPPPWELRDDLEGDGYPGHLWVVRTPDSGHEEPDDQAVVVSIGDRGIGELVESAPADLRALLAEVERLRAELAARPSRAKVLAEAADDLEAQTCGCGCRRGAHLLRWKADEARKDTHPGESTQPADLTVYRASHDSIVMGLYTTATEARKHCEDAERRAWAPFEHPTFDWIEDDEDGVAEMTAWVGGEECATGYVVTALTVASAYDAEADE